MTRARQGFDRNSFFAEMSVAAVYAATGQEADRSGGLNLSE